LNNNAAHAMAAVTVINFKNFFIVEFFVCRGIGFLI
jgi:hypothetical protein